MRWYEGIWWVVLFACFLLYIAKHPENFARYYGNKRCNLMPFNISIFYGNDSSAIAYQQAFFCGVFSFYHPCYCCLSQRYLTLRRLMSYIYGAPILDVSRSHTTTQHSR